MTTVQAAIMPAPRAPMEVREIPLPELEPDSAYLCILHSEVCGTDVHLHEGRLAGVPYPIIPGHVSVGHLDRIRGTLRDIHGTPFREGDLVTIYDVHGSCNACWYCLVAKADTRCPQRKVYGITYGVADGPAGGWAEQLYVKPGTRCIRLGDVPARLFMAGGCGLPTALHAVDQAQIQLAESVLVLGAGPVGLSAVALATLRGAGRVLCIGAPAQRLETARRMGASDCLDISMADEDARREWVLSHTGGRGVDVSIEATGAPEAVVQAMRWTRDAGRVIVCGQYTDAGTVMINPHTDLNRKHLRVQGVWGSDYHHFHRAVQVLYNPRAASAFDAIMTDEYGLGDMNDALAAVADGRSIKALVTPGG
jgi:L-iditol 2-dehydrogenase